MDRQLVIRTLQRHRDELERRGVRHAALFGSLARGDARPDSDIDIMIEVEPAAELDAFEYAGLKRFIATLFSGRVDVVDRRALKPSLGSRAEAEAVHAF